MGCTGAVARVSAKHSGSFVPFVAGESTTGIDWRRSARDDRIYIREREWEAAHRVAIWIDRSPSMGFISNLARQSKSDRALVLGLAAADLLVRGGERVSLLGLTRPLASRSIVAQFAEAMIAEERAVGYQAAELAPNLVLPPRSHALLISDFLSEPRADRRAHQGARRTRRAWISRDDR